MPPYVRFRTYGETVCSSGSLCRPAHIRYKALVVVFVTWHRSENQNRMKNLLAAAKRAPVANRLLAALQRAEYLRLLANLEPVTLALGDPR